MGSEPRKYVNARRSPPGMVVPFPRTATRQWRICGAPGGQGEKQPSGVLHELELERPVLRSRAYRLAASRPAEPINITLKEY